MGIKTSKHKNNKLSSRANSNLNCNNSAEEEGSLANLNEIHAAIEAKINEVDTELELVRKTINIKRSAVEKVDMMITELCDTKNKSWLNQQNTKRDFLQRKVLNEMIVKDRLVDKQRSLKLKLVDVNRKIDAISNLPPPAYNPNFSKF